MERDKVFDQPEDRKKMRIRKPLDNLDIVPDVILRGKNVSNQDFEPDYFIISIPRILFSIDMKFNILSNYDFPEENRTQA